MVSLSHNGDQDIMELPVRDQGLRHWHNDEILNSILKILRIEVRASK